MSAITTDDIIMPSVVSMLAVYQLVQFAMKVGKGRSKFKVSPPDTMGKDPNFDRYFRAHQNTLEFFPIMILALWIGAIYLHQVPSSVACLIYLYSRNKYFDGYVESADKRVPAFALGGWMLRLMLFFAVLGFAQSALIWYTGGHSFRHYIVKYLPR